MDALTIMEQFNAPHVLYLVVLEGNGERFCKIGITSYDVSMRFKSEKKYKVGESFEFHCKSGEVARGRESLLISKLIPYNWHYYPKINFAGKTECYQIDKLDDILNIINLLFFHQDSSFKPIERIIPFSEPDISILLEDFECLQEEQFEVDEFEQIFVDDEADDLELEATLSSQHFQWKSVRGKQINSIVVEMEYETIVIEMECGTITL